MGAVGGNWQAGEWETGPTPSFQSSLLSVESGPKLFTAAAAPAAATAVGLSIYVLVLPVSLDVPS